MSVSDHRSPPGPDGSEHDRADVLDERAAADSAMLVRSLVGLRQVGEGLNFEVASGRVDRDLLVGAVTEIGRLQGFTVSPPADYRRRGTDPLASLARASGVSTRRVELESGWELQASGPVLGFLPPAEPGGSPHPVVLRPSTGRRGAVLWDPATRTSRRFTDAEIAPIGFELFGRLQPEGDLTYGAVARFTFAGARSEIATILVVALGIGLLGLLTPLAANLVFDVLVPEGQERLIWVTGAGLVVAAIVTFAFTVVEGLAVTRMSLRAQQRLQPAVWARTLTLPAGFFRGFSSGELTFRILGADQLRQTVSTSNVTVALTASFSMLNLVLAFVYDVPLALAGVAVLIVVLVVTGLFARRLVEQTDAIISQGRLNNAHISDILEGLDAIRTAAAEMRFFALHAELVRRKVVLQARQQRTAIHLQTFYTGLVSAVPAVFIAVVAAVEWDTAAGVAQLSASTYITFVTAFNAVLVAMVALSALIQPLAIAPPTLAAMQPIFRTPPEYDDVRPDPGPLDGRIELRDVSFRYSDQSSWILERVSFVAQPGQFVALVGPSGAGKSTLLRLLLGFDQPAEGSVYYGDNRLTDVDLAGVRRQLGVVLQSAEPHGGTVLDNVIGARPLSTDDAWRALDAAGLGDDIRAMPMGLQTFVSGSTSTLSGGQLQRLLIARALASRPAVLLLDEATSHLDDITQRHVTESIARLGVTRIVVAHRLSTIVAADRILVLDHGSIVQQGTFDELMSSDGLFADLAHRQQA
jgi:NHLM bacteriocin system ABC transporter ATP-binding protein